MTQKLRVLALALLISYCCLPACTTDQLSEPMELAVCDTLETSYETNVKDIIDRTCAYSGCHIDASIGNFLNYDGMLGRLQTGAIRNRVISLRHDPTEGMPPNYAPVGRARELTQEELEIMQCWLDGGFPEN